VFGWTTVLRDNDIYCFIGEEVSIGEPEGDFSLDQFDMSSEVVLLAAGTGKYLID